ncbi:MAG: hypothetical protein OEN00_14745, partial [Gemmatimonadota bacterium]|nr:hypothetical protein [Gemmatimonadota bacterium]
YQRSEIRSSRVCVLSNIAAIAHLGFARVRTDGSVIVAGDAAYFYTKTPEGWRVVASIGGTGGPADCPD